MGEHCVSPLTVLIVCMVEKNLKNVYILASLY